MVHRGEKIEKAVRDSGMSITELAKRLGKSRRHIYDLFENRNVPHETVLKIGKIIHYDFSKDFTNLYSQNQKQMTAEVPKQKYGEDYWKNKYIELLEKYNELLQKKK